MTKLFFLTLLCAVSVLSVNAQKLWNFSDIEAGTLNKIVKMDGLTIGSSTLKPVVVDANNKDIDGMKFTQRLKFPGPGTVQGRYIAIHVNGPCALTVYGMSSNSKSGFKSLTISKGGLKDVLTNSFLKNDGKWIGKDVFQYDGGETDLFLFCETGGYNLYAIKMD